MRYLLIVLIYCSVISICQSQTDSLSRIKIQKGGIPFSYSKQIGAFKMRSNYLSFGNITKEGVVEKTLMILNTGELAIVIDTSSIQMPKFVTVIFHKKILEPGGWLELTVKLDPRNLSLGYGESQITFKTDENEDDAQKDFYVIYTIIERFDELAEEELQQAPRLVFDKTQVDLGDVNENQKASTQFQLSNLGNSELIIKDIKANCACISLMIERKVIQPNENVILNVVFDATNRRGNQFKNLTIFSNDPEAPSQMLKMKAQVLVP